MPFNPRKNIEQLKDEYRQSLEKNAMQYKRMIIRQLETIWRQTNANLSGTDNQESLQSFSDNYLKYFNLTSKEKDLLTGDLKGYEKIISENWDDYFGAIASKNNSAIKEMTPDDLDRIISLYSLDFTKLNDTIDKTVDREVKKAIAGKYGYEALSHKLQNTGLGFSDAETLASTALNMFDNSYHAETATAAGILYFIYDGGIVEHTRKFCLERRQRVYTLAELAAMDNHQNLPVETSLGGYNCIHYLTALVNYFRRAVGELFDESHYLE